MRYCNRFARIWRQVRDRACSVLRSIECVICVMILFSPTPRVHTGERFVRESEGFGGGEREREKGGEEGGDDRGVVTDNKLLQRRSH